MPLIQVSNTACDRANYNIAEADNHLFYDKFKLLTMTLLKESIYLIFSFVSPKIFVEITTHQNFTLREAYNMRVNYIRQRSAPEIR